MLIGRVRIGSACAYGPVEKLSLLVAKNPYACPRLGMTFVTCLKRTPSLSSNAFWITVIRIEKRSIAALN